MYAKVANTNFNAFTTLTSFQMLAFRMANMKRTTNIDCQYSIVYTKEIKVSYISF